MNKQFKIILGIVIALIAVIIMAALLNKDNVEEKKSLNEDAIFIVKNKGEDVKSFTMEEIKAIGEVTFTATKDTSDSGPVEAEYVGVPLIEVFKTAGVTVHEGDVVTNSAADGYATALEAKKVLDSENVFIAYIKDGEPIGTREEGGNGPYQIIVSKDQFSQYWCKYALSTDVQ
jgi:hypothetical protein